MNCTLLDISCHAQRAAWAWWNGLGWFVQTLIVGGTLAIIIGALWGFAKAVKQFGGWPAVAGAGAIILGLVLAVLPKKPTSKPAPEEFTGGELNGGADARGPFEFGRKKKPRPTIFDGPWKKRSG
ncbi:MAG: hypothetical protein JWQ89_2237 [Devosia sp.]|uniref:hypothetical protein n=1 Tax=Devosia sp. TaxID=1871048 RepID=UPI0026025FCA|nr:hypothetical protein [Devosia sp.]MDB5540510.1 hypothetical protein [Devosia sp.]